MGRAIVNSMPVWVLAPLAIGAFVLAVLLVFAAVVRWGGRLRNKEFNATIGNFAAVAQALFGLTLGLLVVSLYQDYRATQAGVRAEAVALAEFTRLASAFPAKVDDRLRSEVSDYVDEVRTREWRLLREGKLSDRAWADIGAMYATLKDYEPVTASQKSFYSQALTRLDSIVQNRRDALASANEQIPDIIQVLIVLAACVVVIAPMFLVTVSVRFQFVKVGAVAVVVGTALFTASVLQYPFSRALPISKAPYTETELNQLAGP